MAGKAIFTNLLFTVGPKTLARPPVRLPASPPSPLTSISSPLPAPSPPRSRAAATLVAHALLPLLRCATLSAPSSPSTFRSSHSPLASPLAPGFELPNPNPSPLLAPPRERRRWWSGASGGRGIGCSRWRRGSGTGTRAGAGDVEECASCGGEEGCAVGYDNEEEVFDCASFSQLLKKVPLAEVKGYSKMSYLCDIAYMIPQIQILNPDRADIFANTDQIPALESKEHRTVNNPTEAHIVGKVKKKL
ncbi:hypothetical protein PR202_ga00281 [Eleusine coracana subsp. coracana]|uniref:Uncharacterized protein n=1 Tax=Eleusine coracana subsp. coracana TaxID=191504 RepID=A0AAV5BEW8_ELECO|nr:hypothetical protein PR202_ga00281 [Eleusine coracana subsp. coracana]